VSGHGFLLVNYVPGTSLVHRAPLWLKFLSVVGCGMASFLVVDWVVATGVLALMCIVFLASGAGPARLFKAVRPILPVLAAIGLFQWWQLGGPVAARIVLNVLVCVVAASILTATTPMQRLLDGVVSGEVEVLGRAGSCSQSQVQGEAPFEHSSVWRGHQQPSEQPLEDDLLPQSVEGEADRFRVCKEPCF